MNPLLIFKTVRDLSALIEEANRLAGPDKRWSLAFTNRSFGGKPLQYWFDRQRDAPIFNIWPVTDLGNRYGQIEMWRKRYIMDVGTLPQTLDIPQRWYEAVVLQLASRLAAMLPEVPDERMINLTALADRRLREAEDEERDNSPIRWAPNISVYTS